MTLHLLFSTLISSSPLAVQGSTDAEKFALLHDSLMGLYQDYVNDIYKTIAFLLLAIGWFLTSENARNFLRTNAVAFRSALAAIPVIATVHVILAISTYWDSLQTMGRLVQLDYMPVAYYADQRITPMLLVTNLALHLALFTALFVFVYTLRKAKSADGAG